METRTRILDAAWTLLEEHQGKGVRMIDIARRAGVSRQAVYLHFATRTDLLIATTRYVDEVKGVDGRMQASRTARTGEARLAAFIEGWGNYLPEIRAIARALGALRDSDEAAQAAWDDRMLAVRQGCASAIGALATDGRLSAEHDEATAIDLLWTLLSIRNWEQLTQECGWSQDQYVGNLQSVARQLFVSDGAAS